MVPAYSEAWGLRPSVAVEIILPIAGICPWWSLPQALSRCFRTLTIVLGTQIFLCVVLVFLPAPLCVDEVGWGRVGNDFHRALCQLTHLNSEAAENSETHLLPILCRESAPSSPSLPLHPSIPSTSLLFSFCPPFFLSLRESSTKYNILTEHCTYHKYTINKWSQDREGEHLTIPLPSPRACPPPHPPYVRGTVLSLIDPV